jgi:hypothetical protein
MKGYEMETTTTPQYIIKLSKDDCTKVAHIIGQWLKDMPNMPKVERERYETLGLIFALTPLNKGNEVSA